MKTVRGNPITAARPQYSRKRPFVPDAKDTSADEQVMISEAPSPFKNRQQSPQIPAPTQSLNRANPQFHKDALRFGGSGRRVGAANTGETNWGATGGSKPGGYKGNPVITGYPTRGGKRKAGIISTNAGPEVSAQELKAMRSMGKLGLAGAYADFKRYGG
jgi:hypothetical protein